MRRIHPIIEGAHAVIYGLGRRCSLLHHDDVKLRAGDIVVFPRGHAHRLWNGRVRDLVDASTLLPSLLGGRIGRERGGGAGATTRFICGYFGCDRHAGQMFLAGSFLQAAAAQQVITKTTTRCMAAIFPLRGHRLKAERSRAVRDGSTEPPPCAPRANRSIAHSR